MKKPKRVKKIILGITGVAASGKSTLAAIFSGYGAKVVDADKIAHSLLGKKSPIYRRIIATFGSRILAPNGCVDRAKLAAVAFNDRCLLKRLNAIMHPLIIKEIKRRIRSQRSGFIVLDAPLLFEAGIRDSVDAVIAVKAARHKRFSRSAAKGGFDKKDLLKREKAQITQGEKVYRADFVIDNNGSKAKTRKEARRLMLRLGII